MNYLNRSLLSVVLILPALLAACGPSPADVAATVEVTPVWMPATPEMVITTPDPTVVASTTRQVAVLIKDFRPRSEPGTTGAIQSMIKAGGTVIVLERSADGTWINVEFAGTTRKGWVRTDALQFADPSSIEQVAKIAPTAHPSPAATYDLRKQYKVMNIRELDAYADRHIGRPVKLGGRVFNIMSDGLQIMVSNYPVAIYIADRSILPGGVYDDEMITVYGRVAGFVTGTNAFGATVSQPLVEADIIE